jgi:hypothetical protein
MWGEDEAGEAARGAWLLSCVERVGGILTWTTRFDTDEVRWSANAHELLGVTRERLGSSFSGFLALVHPDDRAAMAVARAAARESGDVYDAVYRVLRDDGGVTWLRAHAERAAGHDGVYFGMCTDITAEKTARDALERSEARYRMLFEESPLAKVVYAADTLRYLAVNQRALETYGYSRNEFLEMTAADIRAPEDVPRLQAVVAAQGPGTTHHGLWKHRTKDGKVLEMDITGHGVVVDGTKAIMVVARDVTEQRRLQQQLFHSQKLEAMGSLAAGIAHDFNNVLAIVILTARAALDAAPADGAVRADLDEILSAAQRGSDLARQLLAFSRGEESRPRPMSLDETLRGLDRMLRRVLGNDLRLETTFSDSPGWIVADPGQIEQLIMNLAVNARDAMPGGGELSIATRPVELDVAAAEVLLVAPGPYVELIARDTGCGMDEATRGRIFEPFFTTKPAGRGTGLGLATVFRIVRERGGGISVESTPGAGTTFTLVFPRIPAGAHDPAPPMR